MVHTGWFCQPARSGTGRGLACWGTGRQQRAGAGGAGRGQNKAHDLSGLAGRGVAPLVAERADEVQSTAGLAAGAGPLRCRSGLARVGDRAQHAGPGCSRPSRIGGRGPVSPGPGRACRRALVISSDTTIVLSGLRTAIPAGAGGRRRSPWRRGPIRDLRRARAWRSAAGTPSARGRDPVMASCCAQGRPSPRPVSASAAGAGLQV